MNKYIKENFEKIDTLIISLMSKFGISAIRLSFAIIFIWFGILKPFGLSAAEGLVIATVDWMPFFNPQQWLAIIGWWEVLIGITFLFKKTTRVAIGLLYLQMLGTFLPLVILSEVTFQNGGSIYLPTMEGQYIIKNIMIMSAALIVGASTNKTK